MRVQLGVDEEFD